MDSSGHCSTSPKQRVRDTIRAQYLNSTSFFISFMAVCAKHASRVTKKLKPKPKLENGFAVSDSPRFFVPKSPRPKQLLTTISNKAIKLVHRRKHGGDGNGKDLGDDDFGDGGVWQRAILMGDRCEPLDFSGVIYYDSKGNQLDELPIRSPRATASPVPGYLSAEKEALIRSPVKYV